VLGGLNPVSEASAPVLSPEQVTAFSAAISHSFTIAIAAAAASLAVYLLLPPIKLRSRQA
jgi:hypothetical protein